MTARPICRRSPSDAGHLVLSKKEARKNRYIFLDVIEEAKVLRDQRGFFGGRLQELKKRLAELGCGKTYLPDGSSYWELKPDLVLAEVFHP